MLGRGQIIVETTSLLCRLFFFLTKHLHDPSMSIKLSFIVYSLNVVPYTLDCAAYIVAYNG